MPRLASQNANASLYFNGTSAKMTVPVVPDPTGWCLAMWIEPGDKGTPTHTYVSYNSAAFTDGIFISKNAGSGNININVYNGAGAVYANTLVAPASQWIHIAITYLPNGTCKTYKNGALLSSATSSGTMTAAAAQLLTFNSRSFTNYFAQSTMSNIVWQNTTTSWTDDQVRDIYQTNKLPAGTTMYLALGEGAGTIAYDTSGNGNNGTITSGTWTRDAPSKTRKAVNGNLVYNGDFEIAPVVNVAQTTWFKYIDGTTSGTSSITPFGWYAFDKSGSGAVLFDSTTKYSGNYSLKLSTTATASFCSAGQIGLDEARGFIKIAPSTSYTYSYWMKTDAISGSATSGARLVLSTRDGAGNVILSTNTALVTTTTDWTQYTGTLTTGATAVYLSASCLVKGSDGAATLIMDAWFDDITLTPTTATTRTALTKSRVKIQEDNYSVQWPTLSSGSSVATASANIAALGVSNLNYSGGIWVKELSRRLSFGNIIFRLNKLSPFRYAFSINSSNNDRLQVNFYDGTLNPYLSSPKSYPIGTWYHVAFTKEGTAVKLYINGVLSTSTTIVIGTATCDSVSIGTNAAFAGNVSDAFIYGSVLTADEIYAIYANDVYPSGALLKAKLNDGTGTTAADQSGNGVDFTLTTPTWSTDTATGKRTVVS